MVPASLGLPDISGLTFGLTSDGCIVSLTVLHVALGQTANRRPSLFPALSTVPGESSLTAWQMEQLNTMSTEGAALEVLECVDEIKRGF